jgi:hypothetical protein
VFDKRESLMTDQMSHVAPSSGAEVVDSDYVVATFQQRVGEV